MKPFYNEIMNNKPNIRLQKRLLQFNNLVFSFADITSESYTSSFKGDSTPYTNALHGSYYPSFGAWGKLSASEFEAELEVDFSKLECSSDYTRYLRFIKRELARSGKLWAVQGGSEIIWANARVLSINEAINPQDTDVLHLTIQFELIDGFWVLASNTRTCITGFCVKDFVDFDENYCYSLEDMSGSCNSNGNNCLPCNKIAQDPLPSYIDCEPLCKYSKTELSKMFSGTCPNNYVIRYDCDLEKRSFCYDVSWGEKKRLNNSGMNYGNNTNWDFCSRTDIPTELVKVTLVGSFENPTVTINGRTVTIRGSFNNQAITIGEGLEIYMSNDIMNPYENTTSLIDQATFSGAPYFQVFPGINTINVSGNRYNENSFAYIKPIDLTY